MFTPVPGGYTIAAAGGRTTCSQLLGSSPCGATDAVSMYPQVGHHLAEETGNLRVDTDAAALVCQPGSTCLLCCAHAGKQQHELAADLHFASSSCPTSTDHNSGTGKHICSSSNNSGNGRHAWSSSCSCNASHGGRNATTHHKWYICYQWHC